MISFLHTLTSVIFGLDILDRFNPSLYADSFFVPKRSRWSNILNFKEDVGNQLNKSLAALEEENPELDGVLKHIDFNAKKGKTKLKDSQLVDLIHHFNKHSLTNDNFEFPDLLGAAYEYLIKDFADSAGKKGGEFYTPSGVVRLLVQIIKPNEGMTVYDPTCGSGGMLIQSKQYVEDQGQNARDLALYGQDNNGTVWAICKMNMILHNIPDAQIENDDTIENPQFTERGYIKQFDRVIANPPFSQNYNKSNTQYKQRFHYGFAPETGKKGDLMFVQHMIASLKSEGRMATIMPHGVLFRGGQEKVIREGIIKAGIIEAIIGLPPHLFYGTGIPACILVINKKKSQELKDRILFINADREYGEGRNQNYLRPEDIEKIVAVFDNKQGVDKYSRLVDIKEIEENDFNLNIRRYVDNSPDPEIEDVHAHLVGGVPKREVELYTDEFAKYKVDQSLIFIDKNSDYLSFRPEIKEKSDIRPSIESSQGIKKIDELMEKELHQWWETEKNEIEKFPGNNHLAEFRREALKRLQGKFLPIGVLGEFKIAGILVNWWQNLKFDFKTIVSAGWSPSLISDERIKDAFFADTVQAIEELESKSAELDGELNELFEEIEEWDEEGDGKKTANKVKKYLKQSISDLTVSDSELAKSEIKKLQKLHDDIHLKDKDIKDANKKIKAKQKELEKKIEEKRESFSETEARQLILEKLFDAIQREMQRYLNAERKQILVIFEKLWDKYKISLKDISDGRDEATSKLDIFLKQLKYYDAKQN